MNKLVACLIVTPCLWVFAGSVEAGEGAASPTVGVKLLFSPDYNDTLDRNYADVSGGFGFIGLGAGLEIPIGEKFTLTPQVDLYFNYVSGTESFSNTMVVPALRGQFNFREGASFYVAGDVNFAIPNTGSSTYEVDSSGPGFGAFFGYMFEDIVSVEGGIRWLPVEVTDSTGVNDENFGGVEFSARYSF